jgi:hypothetical protein
MRPKSLIHRGNRRRVWEDSEVNLMSQAANIVGTQTLVKYIDIKDQSVMVKQ